MSKEFTQNLRGKMLTVQKNITWKWSYTKCIGQNTNTSVRHMGHFICALSSSSAAHSLQTHTCPHGAASRFISLSIQITHLLGSEGDGGEMVSTGAVDGVY